MRNRCRFRSAKRPNDVALIVFVPMTLPAYGRAGLDPTLPVILETVAVNVGSSLLPIGNPQNLFLFSRFDMELFPFLRTVGPLRGTGAIGLGAVCAFVGNPAIVPPSRGKTPMSRRRALPYIALFFLAIFAVFDCLDHRIAAAFFLIPLAGGKALAQQVNYALLVTFAGFFIFVGNIGAIPEVAGLLERLTRPDFYLAAVLASQAISNVPAAILLANVTGDPYALLAGASAEGCGTLIASMASLISYKLYARGGGNRIRYLVFFTLVNLAFLAVLSGVWYAGA